MAACFPEQFCASRVAFLPPATHSSRSRTP